MSGQEAINLANAISRLLGWTYVLCWSLSFYPQPILNWQRASTEGLRIEFPTLNILGFVYYSISTAMFLYSPLIRSQYALRNPISPNPTVRFNDLAFGVHAVLLSALTYSQFWCWGYRRQKGPRFGRTAGGILVGCVLSTPLVALIILARGIDGGRDASSWAWIDLTYSLGYVKLLVTVVKYIPQVWTNYKRKSTSGWSIYQILLDFSGGLLSNLQLVLDASLQNDWSGISGNPVKLGLGNISILFDIMFIVQHYYLYRPSQKDVEDDPGRNLLGDDEEVDR